MAERGLDVSEVCTAKVTNMFELFRSKGITDQDINSWDVSSLTNMSNMFWIATTFNQDLSPWNVDNVINCGGFSADTPQWILPKPNFTNCTP